MGGLHAGTKAGRAGRERAHIQHMIMISGHAQHRRACAPPALRTGAGWGLALVTPDNAADGLGRLGDWVGAELWESNRKGVAVAVGSAVDSSRPPSTVSRIWIRPGRRGKPARGKGSRNIQSTARSASASASNTAAGMQSGYCTIHVTGI